MVDFRKAFLLLAVMALVGSIASAQLICTANAGNPPIVRGEGLAEKVGEVIISCTGGTSTLWNQPLPTINVQIFLSTYITSRLVVDNGITSEALLLIDEPQPSTNTTPGAYGGQLACPQGVVCPVYGLGGGNYAGGVNLPTSLPPANDKVRPNMFQGAKAQENSIVWPGVPFDPPGTNGTRVMRIVNIRANAFNAGVSTSLTPTAITMFISISGTGSVTLVNPQITVAWVQYGLGITAKAKTYNQCEPTRDINGASTSTDWITTRDPYFNVKIQELFPAAFLPQQAGGTAQNVPGIDYKTEAAFNNGTSLSASDSGPSITAVGFKTTTGGNLSTAVGGASRATRIIVRFAGVPSGLTVFVPSSINSGETVLTHKLNLSSSYGGYGSSVSGAGYPVSISSGAGAVAYDVDYASTNVQAIDANGNPVTLPLKLGWYSTPLPPPSTVTVSVLFGSTSTNGLMTFTDNASTPRFMDIPRSTTTFSIAQCRTNLLFPYVTNQGGYDTGLVISNTSADPYGTTAQNGTCTINYYGNMASGGAVPGPQTSATVNAGTQLIWLVSAGGGIPATPGFQGYVIAQCNFQYGHGFAFISDYGANKVAESYLALVLDAPMSPSRTGMVSESLGQ